MIFLSDASPGGGLRSVRLLVHVEPASGVALLYGAPDYINPISARGPSSVIDLPTTEPIIYLQLTSGAQSFALGVLSYTEDTGRIFAPKDAPLRTYKGSGPGEDTIP